jgi:hypothetical protein
MSLVQRLNEFRFNLDTLDLMITSGRTPEQSVQLLTSLGFNQQLVQFMLSQRMLLNSVLLRLQLYSEQNVNETEVRNSVTGLNNQSVNHLLDYLYKQSSVSTPQSAVSPVSQVQPVKVESEQDDHQDEESHFDMFFSTCVNVTEDASDSVKLSEMYQVFTKWWSNNQPDDEVPPKDELKEFLSEKLGRQIKSTITHVSLN